MSSKRESEIIELLAKDPKVIQYALTDIEESVLVLLNQVAGNMYGIYIQINSMMKVTKKQIFSKEYFLRNFSNTSKQTIYYLFN